ncbi:MAG: amino acid ABC transporter permease [Lachnospiraceae bacterium]|nr:amino acid ABC transporter permease [Lachnospiraceae bacterium]
MTLGVMIIDLAKGMLTSIEIFLLTLVFSQPLGLLVSLGRMSKNRIVSTVIKAYIAVMRGTPLMLQLIVVYFAPFYIFGFNLTGFRFPAIIIAFSINYAAYFAEIYRGGIEAIPKEQYEAAEVLGYTRAQTFFRIILPQVVKIVLPSVTNEIITLVKDTSLAFVLAQAEMFTIAKQIAAKEASVGPLMVAGVFYFIFNFVVAFVMERIEKKLDYY